MALIKNEYASYLRLVVKQYVALPGLAYHHDHAMFRAPDFSETFNPDHRYALMSLREGKNDPNSHLFKEQERRLIIERHNRNEERRRQSAAEVTESLIALGRMTKVLVELPEGCTPAVATASADGEPTTRLLPAAPQMPSSCKNDLDETQAYEFPAGAPLTISRIGSSSRRTSLAMTTSISVRSVGRS